MSIRVIVVAALVWGMLVAVASAQRSTEMYIPIGQSPGLAGKTSIGTIASVDVTAQTLVVNDGTVQRTVRCDERTPIWVDRSAEKRSSETGALSNCKVGQRVEVKYVDNAKDAGQAEWIKVAEP